jgi:hypothetical protein
MSSYQPYPTGGGYQQYPGGAGELAQRPPQPTSVRNAKWLMYAGAALSAISAIIVLALSSSIKTAIRNAAITANRTRVRQGKTPLTAAQIHTLQNAYIAIIVVVLIISIALWVLMAWANGRGRPWARITATVLFALNTIFLLLGLSKAGASTAFSGVGWLIGLVAIVLLWQRASSAYFKPGTPT